MKEVAANAPDADEIFYEDVKGGLEFLNDPSVSPAGKLPLIEAIVKDGLEHLEKGELSGTVIGIVNFVKRTENPSYIGILNHFKKLRELRSFEGTPCASEHVVAQDMFMTFENWFEQFVLKHSPEGLRQLNQLKQRLLEKKLKAFNSHPLQTFNPRFSVESPGLTQAKTDFKAMSKPAPEGTVKELAAKYGVSLSEIRRRKQEGTLHELG